MALKLPSIQILQESYKAGVLKAVKSPKFPYKPTLLNRVSLWQGDITTLEVDSIVNAANRHLGGGAGVNGAIQTAAGLDLLYECLTLGGCETGSAKITKGYNLPARYIIHAVGPMYSLGDVGNRAALLRSCYRKSLELAVENEIESPLKHIAFPSLSTGIYGYPINDATHIALDETRAFLDTPDGDKLDRVIFVVWSDTDRDVYRDLIPYYFPGPQEEKDEEKVAEDELAADELAANKLTEGKSAETELVQEQLAADELAEGKLAEDKPAQGEPTQDKPTQNEPAKDQHTKEDKLAQDKPTEEQLTQKQPTSAEA